MTSHQNLFIQRFFAGSPSIVIYGAGYYGSILCKLVYGLGEIDVKVVDDFREGTCGQYVIQNEYAFSENTGTVVIAISDLEQATAIAQRLLRCGVVDIRLISNSLKDYMDGFEQNCATDEVANYHCEDLMKRIKAFNFRKVNRAYILFSVRFLLSWIWDIFHTCRVDSVVCPVCKGASQLLLVNTLRYRIMECQECTHIFVANIPTNDSILGFYDGYNYFAQNCTYQGITSLTDDKQWQCWLEARLRFFDLFGLRESLLAAPASILEVGCSEGKLLEYFKKQGHHVYGCDVNVELTKIAGETFGIDIRSGTLAEAGFEECSFDLIIAIHTIEHLIDPYEDLKRCYSLLKKGGKILIEIPIGETDYDNPHHMHFFSERSFRRLFTDVFGNMNSVPSFFSDANGNHCATALVLAEKL